MVHYNSLKGKASLVWCGGYGKHFDLILFYVIGSIRITL